MQRLPFVLLVLLMSSCGRPATQKECEEIVERITQIELKARGMADNTQEIAATKEALRKTTMRDCVGRRISDQAMACVRQAGTTQQILSECF